jgi:amidase
MADARGREASRVDDFELSEITVAELQEGMGSGKWTARRVTELYLARIEAVDRQGPRINSVIEVNPEAIQLAEAADAMRKAGTVKGPLHGIPVLIKDNIATADRMQTTAGSLALDGAVPPQDAFIVERLRAAGAVLLGKTNLSEWANFRSNRSTSGWSGRGGLTRNPYALDRTSCGSSSGSGAAGAANLAALTIGTETDGSIVCPSSVQGLVGIKPTVGLWSRAGIIPISKSQDTAGPMCRTVADAAVLLGPLVGTDPRDPATASSSAKGEKDYRSHLDKAALKGARIGVQREFLGIGPGAQAVYDEAVAALKSAGAVVIDPANFADPAHLTQVEWEVLTTEFKDGIAAYLATLGSRAPGRTLADLIAWNEAHKDREMPIFGQEVFLRSEAQPPLTSAKYRTDLATCRRLARTEGLDRLFTKHRLDAMVGLTTGPAWLIDIVNGDRTTGGSTSYPAIAGYPAITVPAGQVMGLPVGLSFMGRPWSEGKLIGLAYAFEQTVKGRRPPKFLERISS